MSSPPLRVGVVGCGAIARAVHLPVLARMPGVQVTAIADEDAGSLASASPMAREATPHRDFRALLGAGTVDAVVICAPPAAHALVGTAAFDAGLHVYLEKPVAMSAVEAAPLIDAWKRSGSVGMIGFNYRFHPQVREARRRIAAGALGTIVGARSTFTIPPHSLPAWKQQRASGGGVLLDLASHDVDLVCHLLDETVVRAFATAQSVRAEWDQAALHLELSSGVAVQSFASLGTAATHRLELFGTAGQLVIDRLALLEVQFVGASAPRTRLGALRRAISSSDPRLLLRTPGAEPSFALALGAFVRAATPVPGGASAHPEPSLAAGARSLAVIEAAERSLHSGMPETPWYAPLDQVPASRAAAGRGA